MANVRVAQASCDRMIRDTSRARLPENACWTLKDIIPNEIGAPGEKRGGWSYSHSDTDWGTSGTPLRAEVLAWSDFTGGARLWGITIGSSGSARLKFVNGEPGPSSTLGGGWDCNLPVENPPFYRNRAILTDNAGSSAPQSYDGPNTPVSLTGSPPSGSRSSVYKDLCILGRSSGEPQRVWFSAPGDMNSWDTTLGYWDTSAPVTALYALRNTILIFHIGFLERLIGNIAPPGGDMALQFVKPVGLSDARSLAGTDEFVCFANPSGSYMTDGAEMVDLTETGGIKSYWQELVRSATSTIFFAGGFDRGYYFVTIYQTSGSGRAEIASFMCHVETRRWIQMSNFTATCFARRVSTKSELYFGDFTAQRLNSLGSIFEPSSTNYEDDDGTDILPMIETRFYPQGISKSRLKKVHVWYELVDTISANPTIAVSHITTPESTSYVEVTGADGNVFPLAETTELTQEKRNINAAAFGVALKFQQAGNSDRTGFYQLGFDTLLRESSRAA